MKKPSTSKPHLNVGVIGNGKPRSLALAAVASAIPRTKSQFDVGPKPVRTVGLIILPDLITHEPVANIVPGPNNNRLHSGLDEASLRELADSILASGITQPLLGRRVDGKVQLVCGERRYLAAELAGLKTVPIRIAELTDAQAQECQIIENLQRVNLQEIEEAVGYEDALKLKGAGGQPLYTVETLATAIGKSAAYVRGRLKLLALTKDGRAALMDGRLNASIALKLARIPSATHQAEALAEILRREMSFREADEYIAREFMVRLKGAAFDQTDPTLVKGAGTCADCPHRTGNLKKLFPDITSADVCTHTACFSDKTKAHADRVLAAAKKDKLEVKPASENLWQRNYGRDAGAAPVELRSYGEAGNLVDLDAPCPHAKGGKTWRAAVTPKASGSQPSTLNPQPLAAAFVTLDPDSRPRHLMPLADALKAAEAAGLKVPKYHAQGGNGGSYDRQRQEMAATNKKANQFKRIQRHVGRMLIAACAKDYATLPAKDNLAFHQLIAAAALQHAGHDTTHEIVNRRGLNLTPEGKRIPGCSDTDVLEKLLQTLTTEASCLALVLECMVIGNPRYCTYTGKSNFAELFDEDYVAALGLFGLNLKALMATAEAGEQERTQKVVTKKAAKKKA